MTVTIVNLGLPKSGTTTLARALSESGLRCADHKARRSDTSDPEIAGSFVGRQLYRGYFDSGNPFQHVDFYDALTEISAVKGPLSLWPQCDYVLLRAMADARPGLRFVCTWRPAEAISGSMERWGNLGTQRLPNASVPGLPHGFGATPADRIRWIEGHFTMLRQVFAGDHAYLELDMAAPDARERLAAHVGREITWWGRENVNSATQDAGA